MRTISEEEAISLLKKYSNSEESFKRVLEHVKAVQRAAVRIAEKCKGIDMYKIKIGSLLHDIGRFSSGLGKEKLKHGIIGAEILRKEGLEDIAPICERHIGAGISKEDIIMQELPLPARDFIPITKEEKIIAHADNLIFGSTEKGFDAVIERFRKELGEEYVKRVTKLKDDVEGMYENG